MGTRLLDTRSEGKNQPKRAPFIFYAMSADDNTNFGKIRFYRVQSSIKSVNSVSMLENII